jgi:hypothetical protein
VSVPPMPDIGPDRGRWIQELGRRDMVGLNVFPGEPADVTVQLAGQLQGQFFLESHAAWGQPRPQCPEHAHPAEPEVERSVACWTCPLTGDVVGRIGAYDG